MTIWAPDLSTRPGPRYRALAEAIAEDIGDGTLPAGGRLPPQRELAWRLGVTTGTVTRAYALVAQRGLVTGEVGRGTYVRDGSALPGRVNPAADGAQGTISLTINAPPDPGYRSLLAQALAELTAGSGLDGLLPYTPKPGYADHRAAAASWLDRFGLDAEPEQVLITGGAHQAIVAALAGLTRPGDAVLIEQLTYAGTCHVAERLGLHLEGLALDEEGLVPEALDAAARTSRARLLFTNPTVHNPTTATMPLARREAIVALARRHDLIVIEDDVYGHLPEQRAPALATLAPERTVYLTSASKSVAPGLRCGMLLAPAALVPPIADAQHDLFLVCPPLMAELFARWVADGTADRLAEHQRAEAKARQAIAREVLAGHAFQTAPTSYHLWLPLPAPWRTAELMAALAERGVAVEPGSAFAADPAKAPHAVRCSLSGAADRTRLAKALEIIGRTLSEQPARRREVI
jgi:DNA-binding transcriptional MocR family regulator